MLDWERFNRSIHRLFHSWTALQIAVEQGFGGGRSAAKAIELQNDIIAFFHTKRPNVFQDELEDELTELLDDKFNLLVEDGSVAEISGKIIMFFALLELGDIGTFDREFNRISGSANTSASIALPEAEDVLMDDAEMLSEVMEDMAIQSGTARGGDSAMEEPVSQVDATPRRSRPEPDADGWTVVLGNGKRKSGL